MGMMCSGIDCFVSMSNIAKIYYTLNIYFSLNMHFSNKQGIIMEK